MTPFLLVGRKRDADHEKSRFSPVNRSVFDAAAICAGTSRATAARGSRRRGGQACRGRSGDQKERTHPTRSDAGKIIIAAVTVVSVIFVILDERAKAKQARKADEEIRHAESRVEAEPEKAKPAWDLARATLESYFNRNLSQIASIFWLSLFVMIIGFAVIIVGIFQSVTKPVAVAPAVIATCAGIITEFIGATFLFIYRSTIQQAIDYSKTLERINSVGMAMQILDTMPDQTGPADLKSKTKARLVELLVAQVHLPAEKQRPRAARAKAKSEKALHARPENET